MIRLIPLILTPFKKLRPFIYVTASRFCTRHCKGCTSIVFQAEIEQEEAYFKMRETKEDMETKMLSTKEMKVKAVQCLQV